MAGERDLYWGADPTDAQYRTGDDIADNRFVVAEDTDGGTILLEYDEAASEWVSRGNVNLDGNNISNVGDLEVGSIGNNDTPITVNDLFDRAGVAIGGKTTLHKQVANSDKYAHETVQFTDDVGTGGTKIYSQTNFSDGSNDIQWHWIVLGNNNATNEQWLDVVIGVNGGEHTVVGSVEDGGGQIRSYSTIGGGLTLSVGSDTADVICVARAGRVV